MKKFLLFCALIPQTPWARNPERAAMVPEKKSFFSLDNFLPTALKIGGALTFKRILDAELSKSVIDLINAEKGTFANPFLNEIKRCAQKGLGNLVGLDWLGVFEKSCHDDSISCPLKIQENVQNCLVNSNDFYKNITAVFLGAFAAYEAYQKFSPWIKPWLKQLPWGKQLPEIQPWTRIKEFIWPFTHGAPQNVAAKDITPKGRENHPDPVVKKRKKNDGIDITNILPTKTRGQAHKRKEIS